ncbi:MAG: hypothetical protein KF768_09365 [Phycisphaeraceae bacterium]|nr:hypothetical protein [Phycisphaeraceae bacterium]
MIPPPTGLAGSSVRPIRFGAADPPSGIGFGAASQPAPIHNPSSPPRVLTALTGGQSR